MWKLNVLSLVLDRLWTRPKGDVILGSDYLKVKLMVNIFEYIKVKSIPYETVDDLALAGLKHILDEKNMTEFVMNRPSYSGELKIVEKYLRVQLYF